MILDTTLKTIEIVLAGAKTTNDCEYTVDYADTNSGTSFVPAGSMGVTNGTTAVTAVPAPSGVQRHVKALTVYNADTVNSTVTVRMYDGTNRRIVMKVTLTAGQTLVFSPEAGWAIMQSTNGQIPGTVTNDSAAAGCVGEYIESVIPFASGLTATSTVARNITTLSLTAGDWNTWGTVASTGTTITAFRASINDVSATLAGSETDSIVGFTSGNSDGITQAVTIKRFSLAAPATIYLVGRITVASAGLLYGSLKARRVR